jgi:hypothetical protein
VRPIATFPVESEKNLHGTEVPRNILPAASRRSKHAKPLFVFGMHPGMQRHDNHALKSLLGEETRRFPPFSEAFLRALCGNPLPFSQANCKFAYRSINFFAP